jgi:hypothetical protein
MKGRQRSWWRETILWAGVLGAFIVVAVALVLALRSAQGSSKFTPLLGAMRNSDLARSITRAM